VSSEASGPFAVNEVRQLFAIKVVHFSRIVLHFFIHPDVILSVAELDATTSDVLVFRLEV